MVLVTVSDDLWEQSAGGHWPDNTQELILTYIWVQKQSVFKVIGKIFTVPRMYFAMINDFFYALEAKENFKKKIYKK